MLDMYGHKTIIRSEEIDCPIKNYCPCGIDIGYSAIKVKSPHTESIFPSICMKVTNDEPFSFQPSDIRYRDERGNTWFIGSLAKNQISSDDAYSKTNNLLSRQRIKSEEFLVQIRVAMFFCMCKHFDENGYDLDTRQLKVQTGLPPQFLKRDKQPLIERFLGKHRFSIKIGQYDWVNVKIELGEDDISVCRQPFGTLMSIVLDSNGNQIDKTILSESILVVDPGFYSVDTLFTLKGQAKEASNITWENLGMKEVFQRTCDDIGNETNHQADIDVYQLEKALKKGVVYYGSHKEVCAFEDKFKRNLTAVCREFMDKLNTTYNNMLDVDIIILTGGTGMAWKHNFEHEYGEMRGLRLICSNRAIANSQGYYNFLISKLVKLEREQAR